MMNYTIDNIMFNLSAEFSYWVIFDIKGFQDRTLTMKKG